MPRDVLHSLFHCMAKTSQGMLPWLLCLKTNRFRSASPHRCQVQRMQLFFLHVRAWEASILGVMNLISSAMTAPCFLRHWSNKLNPALNLGVACEAVGVTGLDSGVQTKPYTLDPLGLHCPGRFCLTELNTSYAALLYTSVLFGAFIFNKQTRN